MEENLGERINVNRTQEAVATGADQIAVGCPFCRVMLSDGLTAEQADGRAREEVEVLDVAQMLLASVKGEAATRGAAAPAEATAAATAARSEETRAEPEPGEPSSEAAPRRGVDAARPRPPAGGSLFDLAPESRDPGPRTGGRVPSPGATEGRAGDTSQVSDGGSLFDIAGTSRLGPSGVARPAPEGPARRRTPEGGSLFDPAAPDTRRRPIEDARTSAPPDAAPSAGCSSPTGGSLFDVGAPPEPEPEPEPSRRTQAGARRPTSTRAVPCSTCSNPVTCGDAT